MFIITQLKTKVKILLLNLKEYYQVGFLRNSHAMKTFGVFQQPLIPLLIMKLINQHKQSKDFCKMSNRNCCNEELTHLEDLQEPLKLWTKTVTTICLLMNSLMDLYNTESV